MSRYKRGWAYIMLTSCADLEVGDRGSGPCLESLKAIWFLSNNSPDSLENPKATKQTFNVVGPSSARKRNAFTWRFAGELMIACFKRYLDPLSPHQLKNELSWTPSDKTFWIRARLTLFWLTLPL